MLSKPDLGIWSWHPCEEGGKPELRKKVMPIVIVQQRKSFQRKEGVFIHFEDSASVIVDKKGEMKGGV